MTQQWDEFSKSLAEPVPRRESLRRLGAILAGAVLSSLAAGTAWAGGKRRPAGKGPPAGPDPCKSFCRCRNKRQQNACLAACSACNGDTGRLCGTCGSYYCADLANDIYNCGACGYMCPQPGPYENGACVNGKCVYTCIEGAVRCDGTCTSLYWDPSNCGTCGNVCPDTAPYCNQGVCFDPGCAPGLTWCPGSGCVDLLWDQNNCGACNHQCTQAESCIFGSCVGSGGGDGGY
jgi:hypothetical protein